MQTSFQLILDDTSPVVNYYPFAETLGAADLVAGWNSYFTQSGFLSVLGQTGEGTSLHVTGLEGAELTIQWFGTGIALYGRVYHAAYSISVDGEGQHIGVPRGDLLAEVQGLEATQHIIALVAHPSPNSTNVPSSYIAFDQAALNVSTEFTGATVSTEFVDTRSSLWISSGNWTHLSDPVLNSEPTQGYLLSTTQGDSVSISFRGTAVSIIGICNTTMGHYNVTLDGTTTTLDGHSDWLGSSTLFLQAGLDEMSRHSLTITNADEASVAIAGINITHVQGGVLASESSSHGISAGTATALILAGAITLIALSSVLVCFYIRRRRNRSRKRNYIIPPGLSTSSYLKDFTIAMGSSPKHRQSRTSKHELSTFARQANRDRGDSRIELDSEVLIASNNRPTMVDPASPLPFLRIPNTSSRLPTELNAPTREENDKEYRRRSQLGPGLRGRRRDLDENMEEVPLTPSSPDSPSNNSVPERIRTHRTGKRSLSVDPVQHHHGGIPSPNSEVDLSHMVTTPTSPRQERTSLLFSHTTRESRQTSRRSSFGAGHRFSKISDNPPSLSTMQFGRPSRHSGESDGTHAEWSPLPKERRAGPSVGEWRLQTVGRPAPPINPSNWQPPW